MPILKSSPNLNKLNNFLLLILITMIVYFIQINSKYKYRFNNRLPNFLVLNILL